MLVANTEQIRLADHIQIEELEFPGIVLMENAVRNFFDVLMRYYGDRRSFLVLAGPGNNGGDGLGIARYLHLAGKSVYVLLARSGDRYKGDALLNFLPLDALEIPYDVFDKKNNFWDDFFLEDPIVIDALLGTGIKSAVRGSVKEMIDYFRARAFETIAVDVPSGLNSDTGFVLNEPIQATHTVSFQLPKVCHYVAPASRYCGEVHVVDVGIWPSVVKQLGIRRALLGEEFLKKHYRPRDEQGHKGTFGHALVVGGSVHMSGAIALTALACMRSGIGLCTVFTPEPCRLPVLQLCPEAMCVCGESNYLGLADVGLIRTHLKRKDVVVIGPGLGSNESTYAFLKAFLPMIEVPLVLDADGLNVLAAHPDLWKLLPEKVVVTPHPGEMRRLQPDMNPITNRLEAAEEYAMYKGHWIVLKGAHTLIASPNGETWINTSGNSGMATGGSGDVLTGIIGGLLGQGYELEIAVPMGVYLHGRAGDKGVASKGKEGLISRDIISFLMF